jgi:tRNA-guanine family transglycosylase
MDSGGFQLAKKGHFLRNTPTKMISQEEILRTQICWGADLAICLDYPLDPSSTFKQNMRLIDKHIKNVEKAVEIIDGHSSPKLVPVIHGYSSTMLKYAWKKFCEIEADRGYKFKMIAVGSLVPLIADRVIGGSERLVNIFKELREIISRDRILHVLGAGSPLCMRLYYLLGASSLDTRSWITNTWFGKIVFPGKGRRKLSELIKENGENARLCGCPICQKHSIGDMNSKRMLRAIHNAYVYLNEFKKIKREMKEGTFRDKTLEIFKKSKFFRRFLPHVKSFEC